MDFFRIFLNNLLDTGIAEYVAVSTGLLSVWYARRENILVYPVGIVSVAIYVYLCFHAGLYAEMGINGFFLGMSIYGWIHWAGVDSTTHDPPPISRLSARGVATHLLVIVASTVMLYYMLTEFTDSTVPFWDAFTTAVFLVAMWLMARKKLENWIAWIVGDFFCIFLFFSKGLVLSSFQYLMFLLLAVSGYLEWRRRCVKAMAA